MGKRLWMRVAKLTLHTLRSNACGPISVIERRCAAHGNLGSARRTWSHYKLRCHHIQKGPCCSMRLGAMIKAALEVAIMFSTLLWQGRVVHRSQNAKVVYEFWQKCSPLYSVEAFQISWRDSFRPFQYLIEAWCLCTW